MLVSAEDDTANAPAVAEVAALQQQVRLLWRVVLTSLVVSSAALCALVAVASRGASTGAQGGLPLVVASLTKREVVELWSGPNDVIVPSRHFDLCNSAKMPPQIAPIRQSGDFMFMSGILGYEKPCETAVQDIGDQIEKAFYWAAQTLKSVKLDWNDVVSVTSYHVNLSNVEHQSTFQNSRVRALGKEPFPAWSAIGISQLFYKGQVLELQMIARSKPCNNGLECDR